MQAYVLGAVCSAVATRSQMRAKYQAEMALVSPEDLNEDRILDRNTLSLLRNTIMIAEIFTHMSFTLLPVLTAPGFLFIYSPSELFTPPSNSQTTTITTQNVKQYHPIPLDTYSEC